MCSLVAIYLGATSVDAYFPSGARWYDLYTFKLTSSGGGAIITLDSPIDRIPVSEIECTLIKYSNVHKSVNS